MTLYAERLLPHNTEAEEALIGSLLIDGECIARIAPMLQPGDFYRERNQLCYNAALSLSNRNQAIDQLTLAGELARTEKLEIAGGMAYLSHLVAITPTSVHAEDYAGDHLPHRHHAQAHRGGSQRSPSWATATPTTWRPRSGRPRTPSTGSETPPRQRDFQSFRDIFDRYLQQQSSTGRRSC